MSITGTKVDENGNVVAELSENMQEKRNAAFEAMRKKAILVALERSIFSNFVFDVSANDNCMKHLNVEDDSLIEVRKSLIHPARLENVMNIVNDAIMLLFNLTRPWDNNDYRLLDMDMYDDFQQTFQQLADNFEEAVDSFIDDYPEILKESKQMLGKLYNKNDYPAKKDLKSLFKLKVVTRELPDIDDTRFSISEDELVKLEQEAGSKFNESLKDAQKELTTLLSGTRAIIADKAYAGIVPQLSACARALEAININNEPEITEAIMAFKEEIGEATGVDMDDAMMTSEDRERKKYEEMDEDDMLLANDLDSDDDDLDDLDDDDFM